VANSVEIIISLVPLQSQEFEISPFHVLPNTRFLAKIALRSVVLADDYFPLMKLNMYFIYYIIYFIIKVKVVIRRNKVPHKGR
jgi:hypothetical protein